jgi:hypothetical protein
LAKVGGQQLRDAIAQVAKTETLTNAGDGKIESLSFYLNL